MIHDWQHGTIAVSHIPWKPILMIEGQLKLEPIDYLSWSWWRSGFLDATKFMFQLTNVVATTPWPKFPDKRCCLQQMQEILGFQEDVSVLRWLRPEQWPSQFLVRCVLFAKTPGKSNFSSASELQGTRVFWWLWVQHVTSSAAFWSVLNLNCAFRSYVSTCWGGLAASRAASHLFAYKQQESRIPNKHGQMSQMTHQQLLIDTVYSMLANIDWASKNRALFPSTHLALFGNWPSSPKDWLCRRCHDLRWTDLKMQGMDIHNTFPVPLGGSRILFFGQLDFWLCNSKPL